MMFWGQYTWAPFGNLTAQHLPVSKSHYGKEGEKGKPTVKSHIFSLTASMALNFPFSVYLTNVLASSYYCLSTFELEIPEIKVPAFLHVSYVVCP